MTTIIQPYDWVETDDPDIEHFVIRIWGLDRESKRVCVRIEDYNPFCRVQLPSWIRDEYSNQMRKIVWNKESLVIYITWLTKCLKEDAPVAADYEPLQNLYMYKPTAGNQHLAPYLNLRFKSSAALKHATALINKKGYVVEGIGFVHAKVWETKIALLHRYLTEKQLNYCGWIKVDGTKVDPNESLSICDEYLASWEGLSEIPSNECSGWSVKPRVMSFDIETHSHNLRSFPNAMLIEDQITMISYVVKDMNDGPEVARGLIVNKGCNPIEGVDVIVCKNELELLLKFVEMINKYDPTIITGYNIFRFDLPYIKQRFSHYFMEELPNCSCLKNGVSTIKTREWSSSGAGAVIITTLEAEGRISIDVYTIVKRDYKLDRYTLDFVYKTFMKSKVAKDNVSAKQMFMTFDKLLQALDSNDQEAIQKAIDANTIVGRYAVKDALLPLDLFAEMNLYVALIESSCIMKVPMMTIFTAGQQVRIQNQLFDYAYKKKMVVDERNVERGEYAGGFVVEPEVGTYRNIAVLDFSSLYPSIIRAYNICYTTLLDDHIELPEDHYHLFQWEENGRSYRIRFVKKEILPGILPQMCEDLVTQRSKVRKMIKPDNDPVLNVILDKRQAALKVSANSIYGALGVDKGRMPLIEGARTVTYMGRILNEMCRRFVHENTPYRVVYGDTDSIMVDLKTDCPYQAYDKATELSEKLNAMFPPPLKLEPEGVFAKVSFMKKKMYGGIKTVSIDKDSPHQRVISYEEVPWNPVYQSEGEKLYKVVWEDVKKKKTITTYLIVYDQVDYDQYDQIKGCPVLEGGQYDESVIYKRGIASARRDRCLWVRETYLEVFNMIIFNRSLEYCCRYLDHKIVEFMSRQVKIKKLIATAEVGAVYKEKATHPMKLFKEVMKQMGKPLTPGERIDFMVVKCKDPNLVKKGYKMRLLNDYLENAGEEPFDYLYCISNSLGSIITGLFTTMFGKAPPVHKAHPIDYRPNSNYIKHWVKSIELKQTYLAEFKFRYWKSFSASPYLTKEALYDNLDRIDLEVVACYGPLHLVDDCPDITWSGDHLSLNKNLTQEFVLRHPEIAWNIRNLVNHPAIGSEFVLKHNMHTL